MSVQIKRNLRYHSKLIETHTTLYHQVFANLQNRELQLTSTDVAIFGQVEKVINVTLTSEKKSK